MNADAAPLTDVGLGATAEYGGWGDETRPGPEWELLIGTQTWFLDEDDLSADPIHEVEQVLQREGLSGEGDFRALLDNLDTQLWTRPLLCRCLPGLREKWDRIEPLLTDLLSRLGRGFAVDPGPGLELLASNTDTVPDLPATSIPSAVSLYLSDIYSSRLLTPLEQRTLGHWVADKQYLARLASEWALSSGRTPCTSMLDCCLVELGDCWQHVIGILGRIPSSGVGWRGALMSLALNGVRDEEVATLASSLHITEEDARAHLRQAETILRLLPDAPFVWLTDCLSTGLYPPFPSSSEHGKAFEAHVAERLQRGQVALRVMLRHNLRLVLDIARPYAHHTRSLELVDLIQEGALGLLRAIERWEAGRGYAFSTYATWWIKQAINRAVADQDLLIRLPVHVLDRVNVALKDQSLNELAWRGNQVLCTEEENALSSLAVSASAADEICELAVSAGFNHTIARRISHIIVAGSSNGAQACFRGGVPDMTMSAEDQAAETELAHEVNAVLAWLTDREHRVLSLRFGLADGRARTLEEIGRELGVTRERIRQIEAKAFKKLRHPSCSRFLRPFVAPGIEPPQDGKRGPRANQARSSEHR